MLTFSNYFQFAAEQGNKPIEVGSIVRRVKTAPRTIRPKIDSIYEYAIPLPRVVGRTIEEMPGLTAMRKFDTPTWSALDNKTRNHYLDFLQSGECVLQFHILYNYSTNYYLINDCLTCKTYFLLRVTVISIVVTITIPELLPLLGHKLLISLRRKRFPKK